MKKVLYTVPIELADAEVEWLNEMMVFPAVEKVYHFGERTYKMNIGAIVDDSVFLSLKLKHKNLMHCLYKGRQ